MIATLPTRLFCTILIISLFWVNSEACAQGRWAEGYVVKVTGDTVFGKISYKEKIRTPAVVMIRLKDGVRQQFRPSQVKSFTVHMPLQDIYFKSFSTEIDVSQQELSSIGKSASPELMPQQFFAQLLVQSPKSLYTYRDTVVHKQHYLVESPEGTLTDLVFKRYYADESRTQLASNEEYKKQLQKLYTGCTSVNISKLNDAQYNMGSLMRLAKDYNKCQYGDNPAYEYKRERTKATVGLLVGPSRNFFQWYNAVYVGFRYPTSYTVVGGIYINLILPHTQKHLSIYNELVNDSYRLTGTRNDIITGQQEIVINLTYIKLLDALRYQFSGVKLSPFIQLGIGNGYGISLSAQTSDIVNSSLPLQLNRYEQCLLAGVGLSYSRMELELRTERTTQFWTQPVSISAASSTLILLKYRF